MLTGAAHGDDTDRMAGRVGRRSPQGNRLTGASCLLGAVGAEGSENEVALEEPPLDAPRLSAYS